MTTIPAGAIARFERLKQMSMVATATSDGLKPEVDFERQQVGRLAVKLGELRSRYGEVTVGKSGEAFVSTTRKIVRNNNGHRVETFETSDERRVELARLIHHGQSTGWRM